MAVLALDPTEALPPTLVRAVFGFVPADQLARAACVSFAWRDAVADPALWRRLDLSRASGVACRLSDTGLRAAAARARGGLEALDLMGHVYEFSQAALHAVVAANAASLRELRPVVGADHRSAESWGQLHALLRAAPALQALELYVNGCSYSCARRMLRNEPPYGPLRLQTLSVIGLDEEDRDFPAFAAELAAHPSLTGLYLQNFTTDAEDVSPHPLDAVLDAALALRLKWLEVVFSNVSPAVAPALARLLSGGSLTDLIISDSWWCAGDAFQPLDAPTAGLLSDALRASRTLCVLKLKSVQLWDDPQAAVELLSALTGHASLRSFTCSGNDAPTREAAAVVGAALGALVAADAPALEKLNLSWCHLGDEGLGPLVNALSRNTHLRKLKMTHNALSGNFAAGPLLRAVQANTSLRILDVSDPEWDEDGDDDEEMVDGSDDDDDKQIIREIEAEAIRLMLQREAARETAETGAAAGVA
jgi:hypothetical protein